MCVLMYMYVWTDMCVFEWQSDCRLGQWTSQEDYAPPMPPNRDFISHKLTLKMLIAVPFLLPLFMTSFYVSQFIQIRPPKIDDLCLC